MTDQGFFGTKKWCTGLNGDIKGIKIVLTQESVSKYLHVIYVHLVRVTNTGSGTFSDLAVGMLSDRTEFSGVMTLFLKLKAASQFCNIQVIIEHLFAKTAPVIAISNMDYLPFYGVV